MSTGFSQNLAFGAIRELDCAAKNLRAPANVQLKTKKKASAHVNNPVETVRTALRYDAAPHGAWLTFASYSHRCAEAASYGLSSLRDLASLPRDFGAALRLCRRR